MEPTCEPDFYSLSNSFKWKPIYGCPGRYILKEEGMFTLRDIIGNTCAICTYVTDKANDEVCIVVLRNGGIISYKKQDGSFVHTLNSREGFLRKLIMLDLRNKVFIPEEE
ncbi:MAG: hypothetical protein JXJ04_26700 [Spirochaetales bacterium]|nr:hypothetical protein [Spirochaetales bacterium]